MMRRMTPLEMLVRDVGLAWRRLVRTTGFTAIAITSLALGIGVNTLMFTFANAGLLRPLPFPDADRLVSITMAQPDNPGMHGLLPPPMFFLLRDQSRSFDAVGVCDVSVRYREFGIRRALGAGVGNVLGLVIRRALIILAVGVLLGVGTSLVLTRFLERFLWGVTRSDPAIFATIAVILIATGLIAGVVPASRAARMDPLVSLRHE
jgi:hypothetical protein